MSKHATLNTVRHPELDKALDPIAGWENEGGSVKAIDDNRADPAAAQRSPGVTLRLRQRAFEIFQSRTGNGTAGDAMSDWLRAEREANDAPRAEPGLAAAAARREGTPASGG